MDVNELTGDFLAHYGKKGMKWGERKAERRAGQANSRGSAAVKTTGAHRDVIVVQKGKKKLNTSGGKYGAASKDAVNAAAGRQTIKKSGIHALTNKELQDVVTRMNLEQQYVRLNTPQKKKGKNFVDEAIDNAPKLINVAKTLNGSKGKS